MTFQPVDTTTDIESFKMEYKDFLAHMLNYLGNSDTAYSTDPKNEKSKIILVQTHIKKENYKELRPFLGWLPWETVKKTFDSSTQLAMGSFATLPFR